jgi:di/tricarboxylate transporter
VAFSLRLLFLKLVPATALLIALREPLVAVVFQRGAFTTSDTTTTANLLALHSGSLVGEGMFMVAVAALLSLHDSGTRLSRRGFDRRKVVLIAVLALLVGVAASRSPRRCPALPADTPACSAGASADERRALLRRWKVRSPDWAHWRRRRTSRGC